MKDEHPHTFSTSAEDLGTRIRMHVMADLGAKGAHPPSLSGIARFLPSQLYRR